MSIFLGAIADDDTGATDLAGMLTEQGMRVIIVLQDAPAEDLHRWSQDADAVIIGTASRSIEKAEAYTRTASAAKALLGLNSKRLAVKYCSTFDSTAEGNIGASIDAAMDVTGELFTVALPALPVLGRTTYMGYHFVGDKLLSDSVLRDHPLNPMRNSHLPSHLQTQTIRRVGLVDLAATAKAERLLKRMQELRNTGIGVAVLDCVDEANLHEIGEGIAELPLLTGSSAWGMVLPSIWRKLGLLGPAANTTEPTRKAGGSGFLIVSGSCSAATRAQNKWAAVNGHGVIELDTAALLKSKVDTEELVRQAVTILAAGDVCLISTTPSAAAKARLSEGDPGLSSVETGVKIAHELSEIVAQVMSVCPPEGLIVAGGETSSTLMRVLSLGGLRIGPIIEAGVPACVSLARPALGVVLKSGNFGSQDFYGRAIDALRHLPVEGGS